VKLLDALKTLLRGRSLLIGFTVGGMIVACAPEENSSKPIDIKSEVSAKPSSSKSTDFSSVLETNWEICFPSDAFNPSDHGKDIISMRDGSTVITGQFDKKTTDNMKVPRTSIISNISSTGAVNWVTELGPWDEVKKILITDNQNIIAVGHTRVKLAKNNARLHILSKDGKILFSNTYFEDEYWSKITDVEKLDNDYLLISGTLKNVNNKGAKSEVFLAKVDLNGKQDWVRKFTDVERPSHVQVLPNQLGEQFLVFNNIERIRTRTEKGTKSSSKGSLTALKINKAGDVEKAFHLKDDASKSNFRALHTQSGELFITYTDRDKVAKKTTLSIIILNDDLSVINQAEITDKPIQINDIEQSDDGSIYTTGHTNEKGYGKRDIWLGKFSTNGKLLGEKHVNIEDNNEWANAFYLDEENRKVIFTGQRQKDKSKDKTATHNLGSCLWVVQTNL